MQEADLENEVPTATTPVASSDQNSVVLAALGINAFDALVLVVAGIGLVAYLPMFQFEGWSPRVALMLLVVPIGLLQIGRQALRRDPAALFAAAALCWTLIGAISTGQRSALVGSVGSDLSAFLVIGYVAFWGLGRELSGRARELLVDVVIWGAAFNGLVGFAQIALELNNGPFALYYGRAFGLAIHPVYFGAICSMGLIALVARGGVLRTTMAVLYPLIGIGCVLSGSRAALGSVVLTCAILLVVRRDRQTNFHTAAAFGALIVGELVGRLFSPSGSAVSRVVDSGFANRVDAWRYGLEAVGEHPLVGWGFGRFTPAVQGRFDVAFVRAAALDDANQIWFDAHNVIVAVLVATGFIGLALFLTWIGFSLKQSSGVLLWMCVPVALHWMVEPMSIVVAPIAFLALGAARRPVSGSAWLPRPAMRALVILGAIAAGYTLVADLAFRHEVKQFDPDGAASVARMYGSDPIVMDIVGQMYSAVTDHQSAVVWHLKVATGQPDRPYWWTRLAESQVLNGDLEGAFASIDQAYALRPISLNVAETEIFVGKKAADRARIEHGAVLTCALVECDRTVAEIVALALVEEAAVTP